MFDILFLTFLITYISQSPEGLPIIVTIVLAMGVTKMAKNNAIIRKLPAVETLGSATYICSDKTGTLTQNKMTVTKIVDANNNLTSVDFILSLACLCNNSYVGDTVNGEPTENALIYAALNNNINKNDLEKRYPRINEIPFDSKRKLMTTIHKLPHDSYRCITKGAPEMVLKNCNHYYNGSTITELDNSIYNKILSNNQEMAKQALRVIAIAFKDINNNNSSNYEKNLCFVGLIGMIDPPRSETYDAVKNCKLAGVTPIMITGDHPLTALAIAKNIGICRAEDNLITGVELDKMSDTELENKVINYKVFARVSPTHKVRIVKALQKNSQIVAMTGDGVNDAPALKAADIGCSMGIGGTDVAKNASDMILADDNFATIVTAIKEGRGIYENIRKSIHFLLSCNIGEIISILFAIIFSLPSPLLAVQLLWINLVTDSLPAISLGVEPISDKIMNKHNSNNNSFFTKNLCTKIIIEGFLIGLLTLIAFILGNNYSLETGRTMAFAVLGLSQLFHAFNMKTTSSLLHYPIFNNIKLVLSFIICVFLQVSVISFDKLATIFKVVNLSFIQWIIVWILAFMPIPIVELQKSFNKTLNQK